jgi:hypothetical protein
VVWNTSRAGTAAATLDDLKDRDGRETRASNLDDFCAAGTKAALRERSISGKGERIQPKGTHERINVERVSFDEKMMLEDDNSESFDDDSFIDIRDESQRFFKQKTTRGRSRRHEDARRRQEREVRRRCQLHRHPR